MDQLGIYGENESAPWITRLIKLFERYESYELHIVAPYWKILSKKYFVQKGTPYHFFPWRVSPFGKNINTMIHYETGHFYTNYQIKKIVNKIKPDLIHLFGFENPRYSAGVFQFKERIPILISVQGFSSSQEMGNRYQQKRILIEQKIIKGFTNFGVRDNQMTEFIKFLNPSSIFFWHEMAINKPKLTISQENNIDFVFFARITKDKGIEDLIKALSVVKREKKDVSLCIIGFASERYKEKIISLISEAGLDQNVYFKGEVKTQNEVFEFVSHSKICVLPTWADTIPGTILESMFMKIPCISYKTGGIPTLNDYSETIRLVEKGDIKSLAAQMLFLLNNPEYSNEMANNAYEYVNKRWGDMKIYDEFEKIYHKLLSV
jgi:glycosyltransferase involved in cell wall biosynthesis